MHPFNHINAVDIPAALELLRDPASKALAGGTDLLDQIKKRVRRPALIVNLKTIGELHGIECGRETRMGALASVAEIAGHPVIGKTMALLSEAARQVGSPQLRHMGRLGGNLLQDPRCWYFRNPLFPCWLKGGQKCFAAVGRNRHHAIIGIGVCRAVHPSDIAPALIALEARALIEGADGSREIPLESLYAPPQPDRRRLDALPSGALIREIRIPSAEGTTRAVFAKAMDRRAWSFALVSAAVRLKFQEDKIIQARIVLGGVAARPWRAEKSEAALEGEALSPERIRAACDVLLEGARALADNHYKIPLAQRLVGGALNSFPT